MTDTPDYDTYPDERPDDRYDGAPGGIPAEPHARGDEGHRVHPPR